MNARPSRCLGRVACPERQEQRFERAHRSTRLDDWSAAHRAPFESLRMAMRLPAGSASMFRSWRAACPP